MAFGPPSFNLVYSVWIPPNVPPAPADLTGQPGQLYIYSRVGPDIDPTDANTFSPAIWLRAPMGTNLAVGYVVEVATGDGWFYTVRFTDRFHRSFPNEYFGALLQQGVGAPVPGGGILLETGDFVLTEAGFHILLE